MGILMVVIVNALVSERGMPQIVNTSILEFRTAVYSVIQRSRVV